MSIELKIKSKHLAVEAQIIRKEERKLKKQIDYLKDRQQPLSVDAARKTRKSLSDHRRKDVRNENRATFIARAYLAGVPYKTLEASVKDASKFNCYILPRVLDMVNKYGSANTRLSKRYNRETSRFEYDKVAWDQFKQSIVRWLEA